MRINPCRCHGRARKWCWLDWATRCRFRAVCNRHDDWVTGRQTTLVEP